MEKKDSVFLTKNIKLVIWDLDETFWKGTLSEEGIHIIEKTPNIVKHLVDRGIMNSIASKNNYNDVKDILIKLNVWDYFIFPCIDWVNKGEMIKWILEKAQLRDENTLFIDDNHLNLSEAKFYNPELNIASPEFIDEILSHESFSGKDDRNHSRLKQYKILENKEESKKFFSNDTEFLVSSNIKVEIIKDTEKHFERIFELIERTNQLNFTKKRSSENETRTLLCNPDFENACIQVKDKYGDYGIAGFYSLNKQSNELEHFLFSCRVLNLGIEQYIYALLGFPEIKIIPEVASALNNNEKPFWINSDDKAEKVFVKNKKKKHYNLLLKGGCDLEQIFHYLQHENINLKTEFPLTFKSHHQLRSDCTLCMRNSVELKREIQDKLINEVPFLGRHLFETEVFNNDYDVLILSLVNNYWTAVYKEKTTGIKIPSVHRIFDEATGELDEYFIIRGIQYDNELLKVFKERYDYEGKLSPDEFKVNLKFLLQKITKPVIFINATEIPFVDRGFTSAAARIDVSTERIIEMNRVLDDIIAGNKNCYLLDMRKIALKNTDMKISPFHYRREIYIKMSENLFRIIASLDNSGFKLNRVNFAGAVIFKFFTDGKDKIKYSIIDLYSAAKSKLSKFRL